VIFINIHIIFIGKSAVFFIFHVHIMNEAQITMKSLADALGNSTRWEALRELAAGEPLLTIELSEQLGAERNSLSRHMKILHSCGLVTKNRAGQYAIPPGRLVSKEERILDYGICLLRLGVPTKA
jgi:DNA-binding transcriptional ArsR family regulator